MLLIQVYLNVSMRNRTIYTPISRIKSPQNWVVPSGIFSLETLVNFQNKPPVKKPFLSDIPVARVYFGECASDVDLIFTYLYEQDREDAHLIP